MAITKVSRGLLNTGVSDSSDATAITIDSSENVGIGTTSPSYKLEVSAEAAVEGDVRIIAGNRDKFIGGTLNNLELGTYSSSNTSRDVHLSIDSAGGVIIGETTAFTDGSNNFGAGSLHVAAPNKRAAHFKRSGSNGELISFYRGNITSEVGNISISTSSTAYNTSSDYRLKENVTYEFDALSRVAQLKPARFNFIVEKDETVDGFLAHEVSDIVPEAITGIKDAVDDKDNPIYQQIDQSKLVPLLTKAIQEQQEIIDDLKTRIEVLEA